MSKYESYSKAVEQDVVERFMRYVQVDSPSNPNRCDIVPSDPSQHDMAHMVEQDLLELGLLDVKRDEHAYVTAKLPATPGYEDMPTLGFVAHIDSSFDAPNRNIRPHIVFYEGGNLVMGEVDGVEVYVSPDEVSYLNDFVGQDIIVTDGTTLLSADDKAAVAEVIALAKHLIDHPEIVHPALSFAFVPDEEIGHGARLLDLKEFGAQYAYTIDCQDLGRFNYECFNACEVRVTAHGRVVHPGSAKNRLINAILVLEEFNTMLPAHERPEHTEGYEGFFHVTEISGNSHQATYSYIVRDFNAANFEERQLQMKRIARYLNERYGEGTVEIAIKQQYRNMAEHLKDCSFVIDRALQAYERCGVVPRVQPIRGGTDGAQLTFRGLPCPNIATGASSFHSVREFIPVVALVKTVEILENLVGLYADQKENG